MEGVQVTSNQLGAPNITSAVKALREVPLRAWGGMGA